MRRPLYLFIHVVALGLLLVVLSGDRTAFCARSNGCEDLWDLESSRRSPENGCKGQNKLNNNAWPNLPTIDGVYCFNNGTGLCKAFSGRFEFYLDSWRGEVIGPVSSSKYVDEYGYHARVPVSYTVDGDILYADRAINWAEYFTKAQTQPVYNLLNAKSSFSWCLHAVANNWPYKSAFYDKDNRTQIYFYNRQTCFYRPENGSQPKIVQQYPSRFNFEGNQLRLDLDYNPTIFTMEDDLAGEVRLVKHIRQHWYEVSWRLVESDEALALDIDIAESTPCRINASSPRLIHAKGYERFSPDYCLHDYYTKRSKDGINNILVPALCGLEKVEIADYIDSEWLRRQVLEIQLHMLPYMPEKVQEFYNFEVSQEDWKKFAKKGYIFLARTVKNLTEMNEKDVDLQVYTFYARYGTDKDRKALKVDTSDPYYPGTWLSNHTVKLKRGVFKHKKSPFEGGVGMSGMNYVDDIAYLPRCDTILTILGPLYTEFKENELGFEKKTFLGPISNLGLNEMTNAFFAKGDKIYFYHRLNHVAEHQYTCATVRPEDLKTNADGTVDWASALVRAKRVSEYKRRFGSPTFEFMKDSNYPFTYTNTEERFFKTLNVYKGDLNSVEAPLASNFPWNPNDMAPKVPASSLPAGVLALIVLGALAVIILFVLGFVTVRRIVKRRRLAKTIRSKLGMQTSTGSNVLTTRSAVSGGASRMSRQTTQRSSAMRPSYASSKNRSQWRGSAAPGSGSAASASTRPASRSRSSSRASAANRQTSSSPMSRSSHSGSKKPSSMSSKNRPSDK